MMRMGLLTLIAMLAFAGNSLLCRLALASGAIDALSFTSLRLGSGALLLVLIMAPHWRRHGRRPARLSMALMLFGYMLCFSLAYRSLSAATGALLLFGTVQLTMFAVALAGGERYAPRRWLGLLLALAGLVYLLLPGLSAPDPAGATLMILSGLCWGAYSLLGRGDAHPVETTSNNFLLATPLALAASLLLAGPLAMPVVVQPWGLLLAVLSGALASGLGYVAWYAALRGLAAGPAATVQLSVPLLAAAGGVLLLGEALNERLLLATPLTLIGIGLMLRPSSTKEEYA